MKRFLALLLALAVWMSLFMLPVSASGKNSAQTPSAITNLKITTANKKKLLKLTWDKQSGADGYQIYRSTTGKTGSYKKIATLQNKSVYVDKNLKAAKTYYYAVRAFHKADGKNYFGSFVKTNLSTKLTAEFLKKYMTKANHVSLGWAANALEESQSLDMRYQKTVTVTYPNGYQDRLTFALIRSKKYKCVADIEHDLAQYFFKASYKDYIDGYYRDIDGKLYGIVGDPGGDYYGENGVLTIDSLSDKRCRFHVDDLFRDDDVYRDNPVFYTENLELVYRNGRWLFTDLLGNWGLYEYGNSYWDLKS